MSVLNQSQKATLLKIQSDCEFLKVNLNHLTARYLEQIRRSLLPLDLNTPALDQAIAFLEEASVTTPSYLILESFEEICKTIDDAVKKYVGDEHIVTRTTVAGEVEGKVSSASMSMFIPPEGQTISITNKHSFYYAEANSLRSYVDKWLSGKNVSATLEPIPAEKWQYGEYVETEEGRGKVYLGTPEFMLHLSSKDAEPPSNLPVNDYSRWFNSISLQLPLYAERVAEVDEAGHLVVTGGERAIVMLDGKLEELTPFLANKITKLVEEKASSTEFQVAAQTEDEDIYSHAVLEAINQGLTEWDKALPLIMKILKVEALDPQEVAYMKQQFEQAAPSSILSDKQKVYESTPGAEDEDSDEIPLSPIPPSRVYENKKLDTQDLTNLGFYRPRDMGPYEGRKEIGDREFVFEHESDDKHAYVFWDGGNYWQYVRRIKQALNSGRRTTNMRNSTESSKVRFYDIVIDVGYEDEPPSDERMEEIYKGFTISVDPKDWEGDYASLEEYVANEGADIISDETDWLVQSFEYEIIGDGSSRQQRTLSLRRERRFARNMSYVRFENTYKDLQDVYENLNEGDLSESESDYREELIALCQQIVDEAIPKSPEPEDDSSRSSATFTEDEIRRRAKGKKTELLALVKKEIANIDWEDSAAYEALIAGAGEMTEDILLEVTQNDLERDAIRSEAMDLVVKSFIKFLRG